MMTVNRVVDFFLFLILYRIVIINVCIVFLKTEDMYFIKSGCTFSDMSYFTAVSQDKTWR